MTTGKPLEGKVALVTGASRGIGLAIARTLGRMGAGVGLCARGSKTLENAASELQREGIRVHAIPADLTRPGDIAHLVEETERSLGPIEILVNNAGIGWFGPAHEASEVTWDAVLDTNLKA